MKIILGPYIPSPVWFHFNTYMDRNGDILNTKLPQGGKELVINGILNRRFCNVFITKNWIITTATEMRDNQFWSVGAFSVLLLDKNSESAQTQILSFFENGMVSEVTSLKWKDYAIDDQISQELRRINTLQQTPTGNIIEVNSGRVAASIGEFKSLLARRTVGLHDVRAPARLITNEVISMWPLHYIDIKPILTNDGQIPTLITEDILKYPILKKSGLSLDGFLNLNLTFPAILKFAKETIAEGPVGDNDFINIPNLGIIGYQEMPAVLQYYLSLAWIEWESCLCYTNNSNYLRLSEMLCRSEDMDGWQAHFGISLDRDLNGAVKNAVIPVQLVNRETFEEFKELVQVVNYKTPIESVVANRIKFGHLSVHTTENLYDNYLRVRASIIKEGNSQWIVIEIPIVDQSSTENSIAKILKCCSTISSLHLWIAKDHGNHKATLTDRMFSLLMEHAVSVEVEEEWSMDFQLNEANLARFWENKTAGLFKNLKQ